MAMLTRWDPLQEMQTMRSVFDRLFDGDRMTLRRGEELGPITLGIDVVEHDDEFVVKAPVPGVGPDDVQINIEDDVLTISGETKSEENIEEERYIRRELQYGSFKRSLRLPPTVDAEQAAAEFDNGMLLLHLPKRPETKPRSIKVTPKNMIEGKSQKK